MKTGLVFVTIALLFLIIIVTGFNPLGRIRSNEPVQNNEELEIHVNVNNNDINSDDLENVHVRSYIIDIDEMLIGNSVDINKDEKASVWIFYEIPEDLPEDDYLVRVVVSGDNFKDVDYTWFTVY